jgi:hypothetical protein
MGSRFKLSLILLKKEIYISGDLRVVSKKTLAKELAIPQP